MSDSQPRPRRIRSAAVVLLAFTSGWVDAVGFMVLFELFVAHMSGNSIAMNVYLGAAEWSKALHHGFPIPIFLIGVALGMVLNEALWRRGVPSMFAFSLSLEAILLGGFAWFGGPLLERDGLPLDPWWRFHLLAALPILAMGIQNATLKRAGGESVRTTYVSGVLTDCVQESIEYCFQRRDRFAARTLPDEDFSSRRPTISGIALLAGLWLAYAAGGLLGALGQQHWRLRCLAAPIACLMLVAACDWVYPLASSASAD